MILKLHKLAVRIEDRKPGRYIHWLCVLTDMYLFPSSYILRGSRLAYWLVYGWEPRDIKIAFYSFCIGSLIMLAMIG